MKTVRWLARFISLLMMDLNRMIPAGTGWTLIDATAINDQGEIVGQGTRKGYGTGRGFLLTPRPSSAAPVETQDSTLTVVPML